LHEASFSLRFFSTDNSLRNRLFPDIKERLCPNAIHAVECRAISVSPYIICYRFDDTALAVYRILHQRQNIDTYALVDLPE